MGLRDLLGLRRGDKGNNAAAAGRDAYSSEHISEAVPEQGASGSSILDEPVTSGFSTPAGMVSRADLAKMGTGASGVAYNPYTGLGGPFDPQMSKALYTITDSPELLFDEERRAKTRSWGENITFLTGVGYLSGVIAGGGYGAYKGLSSVPEAGLVDTQKLKLNRVLNAAGSRGTSVGTWMFGLYYAALGRSWGTTRRWSRRWARWSRARARAACTERAWLEGGGGVRGAGAGLSAANGLGSSSWDTERRRGPCGERDAEFACKVIDSLVNVSRGHSSLRTRVVSLSHTLSLACTSLVSSRRFRLSVSVRSVSDGERVVRAGGRVRRAVPPSRSPGRAAVPASASAPAPLAPVVQVVLRRATGRLIRGSGRVCTRVGAADGGSPRAGAVAAEVGHGRPGRRGDVAVKGGLPRCIGRLFMRWPGRRAGDVAVQGWAAKA